MTETSRSGLISTRRQQIAKLARDAPSMVLTTLTHHIDMDWLREAHRLTRKNGAAGVDGQTAKQYAERLDDNLSSLLNRAKSGTYRAPPVRRVYIPKGNGKELRPLGIPTFEDKVLQRAVAMVLQDVYEQDFLDCSYGFRPGRSPHQALDALREQLMARRGGWVIEIDIRKYFDSVDHQKLGAIVRQRIRDGVLLRLIGKWLNAGVLEEERVSYPESGTPQGGVISPVLSNIFLHEVLDKWFEHVVRPRLKGMASLVRFADDAVLTFSREEDARRVLAVLPKRFEKYGLKLHPEKTRLTPFEIPERFVRWGEARPGQHAAFDFLGFTHYWTKNRNDKWVIKRKTAKDRLRRSLRNIYEWMRAGRHNPVKEQYQELKAKMRGHYNYYGITGNWRALGQFKQRTLVLWMKALRRRSQRDRRNWGWLMQFIKRYPLPPLRIAHRYVT